MEAGGDEGGELGRDKAGGSVKNISTVEVKAEPAKANRAHGVALGEVVEDSPAPMEPMTLPAVTNRRL